MVTTLNSIVLNDCMFSFVRYFLLYTFFATWILLYLFDVGVEIETKPRLENVSHTEREALINAASYREIKMNFPHIEILYILYS